jgi:hypothetical protein
MVLGSGFISKGYNQVSAGFACPIGLKLCTVIGTCVFYRMRPGSAIFGPLVAEIDVHIRSTRTGIHGGSIGIGRENSAENIFPS